MTTFFSVGQWNVRSLVPRITDLKNFLHCSNYNIFAVTETCLTNDIDDSIVGINGYEIVRCDRGSRGGGVAWYVRTDIKYRLIKTAETIEQVWLTFKVNNERSIDVIRVVRKLVINENKLM